MDIAAARQVRARQRRPGGPGDRQPGQPNGVIVSGGLVRQSVLSPGVRVNSWATVERVGAAAQRDRSAGTRRSGTRSSTRTSSCPRGRKVGVDKEHDRARGFVVSPGGITVVGKGQEVVTVTRPRPGTEGRAADPRVPARGVRRRGRARRVPGARAGAAGRPHRALPGRGPPGHAVAHQPWDRAARRQVLQVFSTDLSMADAVGPAPTWCTRTPGTPTWPGTSRRCCYGIPHVVTMHSLEPLRPWKAEQLGGGYALSSWAERTSLGLGGRGGGGLRRHAGRHPVRLPGDSPPNGCG